MNSDHYCRHPANEALNKNTGQRALNFHILQNKLMGEGREKKLRREKELPLMRQVHNPRYYGDWGRTIITEFKACLGYMSFRLGWQLSSTLGSWRCSCDKMLVCTLKDRKQLRWPEAAKFSTCQAYKISFSPTYHLCRQDSFHAVYSFRWLLFLADSLN